jgi:hypothetical protein
LSVMALHWIAMTMRIRDSDGCFKIDDCWIVNSYHDLLFYLNGLMTNLTTSLRNNSFGRLPWVWKNMHKDFWELTPLVIAGTQVASLLTQKKLHEKFSKCAKRNDLTKNKCWIW